MTSFYFKIWMIKPKICSLFKSWLPEIWKQKATSRKWIYYWAVRIKKLLMLLYVPHCVHITYVIQLAFVKFQEKIRWTFRSWFSVRSFGREGATGTFSLASCHFKLNQQKPQGIWRRYFLAMKLVQGYESYAHHMCFG